jgi:uncharacterized protein YbbC (DUF1343 family)
MFSIRRGVSSLAPAWLPLVSVLLSPVPLLAAPAAAGSQPDAVQQQIEELLQAVRGKRVGMLTNPTSVDNQVNFIPDILVQDPNTTITAFFAPEHGLRGDRQAGAGVDYYLDPSTGIPVYSVYGSQKAPSDEQLQNVDVLLFDIQDVGVRFYTFVWSMTYSMEAAAKNNKPFIVFDRPNPIGGLKVEGSPNTIDSGLVGRVWPGQPFGVATRHGMTAGEFARLVNEEWMDPKAQLQVIAIPGYTRDMYFEDTGRPWVIPSPNMPTVDTATVYPGMCVFEGVNVSEGRGTTKPFEFMGAPFIDGVALARDLNALGLPGVRFRPAYFQPSFDDYRGEYCGGVQVHVMDRDTFDPIRTALHILQQIKQKYPDQVNIGSYSGKLMGVPDLAERIPTESVEDIIASWQDRLEAFKTLRAKYLLYPESAVPTRTLGTR